MTLEGEARRDRCEHVAGDEARIVERSRGRHPLEYPARLQVVADLQLCILQIVERVQPVERNRAGMSPRNQTPRSIG